jgi:hypothetical protein
VICTRSLRPLHLRVFFALLAVVYLTVFPYLQAINNPNENTRVYLVMALVDEGTFRLDATVRRYGWTNDMAKVPDPGAPGGHHLAAVKGPAMTYLGLPVYVLQKGVARLFGRKAPDAASTPADAQSWLRITTLTLQLFTAHIPCLLFLIWLERRLRRFSSDVVLRLSAVAAVGLGTNYLAYSLVFVSHAWSAVAAYVAFELVAAERARSRGAPARARDGVALAAGAFVGLTTLLEYQGFFVSVALAAWAVTLFRTRRTALAFVLGGVPSVLLLMLFQWKSFGSPFTPGHRMMETEAFRNLQSQGLFGITRPNGQAAWSLLFDRGYGLFGTSAYLWLGFLGLIVPFTRGWSLRVGRRERAYAVIAAATVVVVLVLTISSAVIWRGGWTIGPRYLGAAPPFVALLALVGLETIARRHEAARTYLRALAVGLALASFVQGGAIGLVVSTLPEAITRPAAQVLVPFLRLRLLPHHAFEVLGIEAAWPALVPLFAGAAVCLFLFGLPAAEPRIAIARRAALGALICAIAVWPAFELPAGAADHGSEVRALFYSKWEPRGRDRAALARERAASDPCVQEEVARWEDVIGRPAEAAAARRAATSCAR